MVLNQALNGLMILVSINRCYVILLSTNYTISVNIFNLVNSFLKIWCVIEVLPSFSVCTIFAHFCCDNMFVNRHYLERLSEKLWRDVDLKSSFFNFLVLFTGSNEETDREKSKSSKDDSTICGLTCTTQRDVLFADAFIELVQVQLLQTIIFCISSGVHYLLILLLVSIVHHDCLEPKVILPKQGRF